MSQQQCDVRTQSVTGEEVRCDLPESHEKAHSVHRDGRPVISWVTREEFSAAEKRGEFDHDYCRCVDPLPVCDDCGGEIL